MPKDKSKKKAAEPDIETPAPKAGKKDKTDKKDKGHAGPKPGSGDITGPGSGGNFVAKDVVGELLLITPTDLEKDVVTTNGTSDAIRADIVVLDKKKPAKSDTIEGGLIFQKVLQGQLRDALAKGTRVVGTLIEDTASQKKGQSAPYRLTAPSDEDIQLARQYLDTLNPLR
jgi:hypothetical protein